jgi:hypothetical protein
VVKGFSQQFTATGKYSDGTSQNLTTVATWSSSNAAVAAVSNAAGSQGLATALAAGTTTITAKSGSVSGSAAMNVTDILSSGTALLSWTPPTTNIDGTPLTDLAGYVIYYGTSSSNYTNIVDVGNVNTYSVNGLPSGTIYFAVTAYDTSGYQSGYSNEGIKLMP